MKSFRNAAARLRLLSAILRDQDTLTKFGCFVQEATDIDFLISQIEAFEKDALRFRKLASEGVVSAHAKVVEFQEVKKPQALGSRVFARYSDEKFEDGTVVVYEQHAVREIRFRWVDKDGSQKTLLQMLDAALEPCEKCNGSGAIGPDRDPCDCVADFWS